MKRDRKRKQNFLYTSSLLLVTTHTDTPIFFLSLLEQKLEKEARQKKRKR